MELVLEVNNPSDREGAFIKAVVEQILHKKPLGHAIRYWWNPCVHNLFGQTSFACEGSATSICRCQLSSPLPVRESSVRLELPRRCALVWSYLIYAGINILWGFLFPDCKTSTWKFPKQLHLFYCLLHPGLRHRGGLLGFTKWPVLILTLEQIKSSQNCGHNSHKSIWNRLISPFSHLLFRAVEGFPSSSRGELLPGQTAVLWALCLCAPQARFSQNCCPPSIIPYLLGHWNWDFLPASDWILENPCLKLRSSLSFSEFYKS